MTTVYMLPTSRKSILSCNPRTLHFVHCAREKERERERLASVKLSRDSKCSGLQRQYSSPFGIKLKIIHLSASIAVT